MLNFLIVGFGAAFGGMTRYSLTVFLKKKWKSDFPWPTFLINLSGSFLLGFIVSSGLSSLFVLLLGTGFMGGYTTFSTFKVENIELYRRKEFRKLGSYLLFSYGFGLLAAFLGILLGTSL
ncbi:camphor resistance protein CrcB [Listeria floridensis FSL S10-1187]|uniref:Fluoride-specific ion channel FluC n=1 Tax=Listeria floridensis FSL S10-1187 TaxID=1265817 RepID=A0ABN0RCW9_9LIST|nr:fluoride efflux transporter CrcB [Listeria floridensis]EUJ28199.1 camphor resistance protein CrcB [Listeria floridensis FSL S10-1187]